MATYLDYAMVKKDVRSVEDFYKSIPVSEFVRAFVECGEGLTIQFSPDGKVKVLKK